MARRAQELDVTSLFSENLRKAVARPSIHNYKPHVKQKQFHQSPLQQKLYIGGNRSGKTVGGIVEDVWWLKGEHPYRPLPMAPGTPCRGRIVTTSMTEGIKEIIIPELCRWLPPSLLLNGSWEDSYHKTDRKLTLTNGATCELMSYDQDLQKFAGTSRHFIHFDEEPPKAIWGECKLRLLDTRGSWWITMTPVDGMTWVYEDLYEKHGSNENLLVIEISIEENPYITQAEIEIALDGLDESEKKARREGKFVPLTGLVFSSFSREDHVIPSLSESGLQHVNQWTQYVSMDHGLSNPTAWLWHAISPQGLVVTYDELYDNERLVNDYAQEIHRRNGQRFRRPPEIYVGDPAIKQRNGQTGDSIQTAYSMAGIPIVLGNNDVRIGVEKMNRYFRAGKWVIAENCFNLIRELQLTRWKAYESAKKRQDNNPREEIHKKNDHAPDSARYMFSLLPDLVLPKQGAPLNTKNLAVKAALAATTVPVGPHYIDTNLIASLNSPKTEWVQQDDNMGGWY